ncbi:endocuticle structural protein SgAbd-6 isoform X1 [Drosophila biarmipes]|uniref:endocuticle structural protein SgAbd-6 isoform X1 n=1 Tax=Drosophila biarmipes TaxID=125945 RepID=UPI0007E73D34|nr:endocuticle structural protein SgAbd-6 isoform X1 [Drosophila biarmipes]
MARLTLLLGLILASCCACPSTAAETAQILRYENDANSDSDGYAFSFETSDGISREERATLKNPGTPEEAISVQGSVNWVGPDGVHYKLNYLADENGFQAQGEHLPQVEP